MLGGLGGELRVKVRVMIRARVKVSKLDGELLHQRHSEVCTRRAILVNLIL